MSRTASLVRPFRRAAAAIAAGALLALASPASTASAQTMGLQNGNGFDLRVFRAAVDSKGLFSVNGTDILGAGNISFGFIGDFGLGLLRAGVNRAPLIDNQFAGVLAGNIGVGNVAVLGLQVPIQVLTGPGLGDPRLGNTTSMGMTSGPLHDTYRPGNSGFSYQGLGDITVHAKFRWLRAEYYPVGLAIIVQAGFNPMFGSTRFAGEPFGFAWPQAALELRPSSRVRVDFNLGFRLPFGALGSGSTIRNQTENVGTTYGPSLTWGAGVSWRVAPVVELVAETYGQLYMTGFSDVPASLPWEAMGGAKIFVQRNSYLTLAAGRGLIPGAFAASDFRAALGIVFEPTVGDTDGDGYRDDVDQCVADPEDFDGFQDEDGCSDPDNDRDGILDTNDSCPNVPEDRDGDQDGDGCPEGQESDRDGDGINDNVDQCADDPEDRDGFEDQNGCPDPDNDQDTIPDPVDTCPNDPEDFDGFQDDDGCPDPDNDQDGILDVNDRDRTSGVDCRNEPETMNGVEDEDGCPDSGALQRIGNEIRLREQIQFETDSAQILPVSFPIIDQMANLLRNNAQLQQVEVEGHTDERADDNHNRVLSNDRANSVVRAIVERGIAADRLVAAGYGEYCPLDPRHNAAAWQRNRRVQFVITRTRDEGRTTAAAGCRRGAQFIPPTVGPPGTGVAREDTQTVRPAAGGTPAPGAPANPPAPSGAAPAPGAGAPGAPAAGSPRPRR